MAILSFGEDSDNYYIVKTYCRNCAEHSITQIKKGTLIQDYLIDKECENCGCKTLTRDLYGGDSE